MTNFVLKRNIVRKLIHKIADSIKQRREILGISQEELSSISGISKRTVQLIEAGKGNPSIVTLIKIADTLGLEMELTLKKPGINTNESTIDNKESPGTV